MLTISLKTTPETDPVTLAQQRCIVGRGNDCGVSLAGWRVSRRHAEIFVSNDRKIQRQAVLVGEQSKPDGIQPSLPWRSDIRLASLARGFPEANPPIR